MIQATNDPLIYKIKDISRLQDLEDLMKVNYSGRIHVGHFPFDDKQQWIIKAKVGETSSLEFKNALYKSVEAIQLSGKKIVIMSGKKGHGKDFLAEKAIEAFGGKRIAFADPIKRICAKELGWDGKKDERGRKLLQLLGTEVARAYNPDIWAEKAYELIKQSNKKLFFITDCRFPNELAMLTNKFDCLHVHTLKIEPKKGLWQRFKDWVNEDKHESEIYADLWVKNDVPDVIIETEHKDPQADIDIMVQQVEEFLK